MGDIKLFSPPEWADYELIDSGGLEKLERFGKFILARPEPQAIWKKSLAQDDWDRLAHATFRKEAGKTASSDERGEWVLKHGMPQQWRITYQYGDLQMTFRLGLTAFKHVGIFPEQSENWNYIYRCVCQLPVEQPRVLNLFAYTGGASLAARAARADVTHVDSVRQVINWSRENMEASKLSDIWWVVDDALKYMRREVRRGKQYHGIILDPPAYGRGPDGEKWILEDGINELMELCRQLTVPNQSFLVLNLYSMGFSPLIAENLVRSYFPDIEGECGELFIPDKAGKRLPLGIFMRGQMNSVRV
ncbi:MAG: class I SAM-dependent methyltransferase [Bacteroidales bacterium]|jgi:23S rRNA (cytosine1962-C5)-methyltransferase|nr:class I SAM-dependent methyltransferase [Bacteroidales bacterium]